MRSRLQNVAVDVAWGVIWALMFIAVALFSSGASRFIYIDF